MKVYGFILAALLMLAASPARGFGDPRVQPLFSSASPDSAWVPLLVTLDVPAPGGVLYIRDTRGGLEMGRHVDAGSGRRVVMGLPLVSPDKIREAAGVKWEIQLRVVTSAGAPVSGAPQTVVVERGPDPREDTPLRVLTVEDRPLADAAALSPLSPKRGVSLAALSQEDILNAPALALAGADAVAVDSRLAQALTAQRAAELFSVGIRLLYIGTLPPRGELSKLEWTQNGPLWLAPADLFSPEPSKSLTPPPVVEEHLREIRSEEPQPPAGLIDTALWLSPAVVLLILLVRAFTARPWIITIALGLLLSAGAGVMIGMLRPVAAPSLHELSWTTRCAPGNLAVHETLALQTTLFPAPIDAAGVAPIFSLPISESAAAYFALAETGDRLLLDTHSTRFFSTLQPRRTRALLTRTVEIAPPLPAGWNDPAWIRDLPQHHLSLASSTAYRPGTSRPLNSWINEQNAATAPSLRAWYALRFWGNRSVNLLLAPSLTAIDFGVVPEPSPP